MRQQLADYRVFWRQFRDAYHSTGAVLPSGRSLARALSRYVREPGEPGAGAVASAAGTNGFQAPQSTPVPRRRILEVGPGTGAVTAQIVVDLRPGDQLDLVERNDQFVAHLRKRIATAEPFRSAADRITLLHAAVEDLPEDQPYDLIISGLPLNNFTAESVHEILTKMRKLLAPGGAFSFFEYVAVRRVKSLVSGRAQRERLTGISRLFREVLSTTEVRRDLVLANVPPAWVHHVRF
jgi:phosphatidylethanolamine/phosphatidyl-N-methylethanolamine N-methyltransferase